MFCKTFLLGALFVLGGCTFTTRYVTVSELEAVVPAAPTPVQKVVIVRREWGGLHRTFNFSSDYYSAEECRYLGEQEILCLNRSDLVWPVKPDVMTFGYYVSDRYQGRWVNVYRFIDLRQRSQPVFPQTIYPPRRKHLRPHGERYIGVMPPHRR